ncbi:hydratase [Vibrio methylphosphonaticus]|uniref:hydratase n=1 Tax=Vibrio methylphosphonaticus TaxID=2946866 RepID=UPI00202A525F|nr:hydratase [Vibrio methylphosphonaticus]MCL9775637.1 hydratase [Vibrio methylphosphonaticus]
MTNYNQAAKELLNNRASGEKAPRMTEALRPKTLEDALQIQSSMIDLHTDKVGGWKCLQPLAEDKYIVAPIFAASVQNGERCELFADNDKARLEPEIAFVLSKSLPANPEGYSEEQINDAIGSCHMALELIQSRFANDSGAEFYEVLADGLVNQGLFIGPEIDRDKAFLAENVGVSITQGEQEQTFAGVHPNSLPTSPIYWLINFMTRRGTDFLAGEALITGSYCGVVEVDFEKPTLIKYEGLGEYQVTFKEK